MWVLRRGFVVLLLFVGSACASGSDHCNREGCDALGNRAVDTGKSGIAGVVAEESDAVTNSCQECPFGSAQVDFWATDGTSDATSNGQPTASVDASGQYSIALEPGSYSACVQSDCVTVTVHANQVTTLNIRRMFGPTQFVIHEPA